MAKKSKKLKGNSGWGGSKSFVTYYGKNWSFFATIANGFTFSFGNASTENGKPMSKFSFGVYAPGNIIMPFISSNDEFIWNWTIKKA